MRKLLSFGLVLFLMVGCGNKRPNEAITLELTNDELNFLNSELEIVKLSHPDVKLISNKKLVNSYENSEDVEIQLNLEDVSYKTDIQLLYDENLELKQIAVFAREKENYINAQSVFFYIANLYHKLDYYKEIEMSSTFNLAEIAQREESIIEGGFLYRYDGDYGFYFKKVDDNNKNK